MRSHDVVVVAGFSCPSSGKPFLLFSGMQSSICWPCLQLSSEVQLDGYGRPDTMYLLGPGHNQAAKLHKAAFLQQSLCPDLSQQGSHAMLQSCKHMSPAQVAASLLLQACVGRYPSHMA